MKNHDMCPILSLVFSVESDFPYHALFHRLSAVESLDSEAGEHYLSRPRCQVCPTACIKFEPPPFIGILGKQKKGYGKANGDGMVVI